MIGQAVLCRGRRCYVLGVGPMSMPGRRVELADAETGRTWSAPFVELEPDVSANGRNGGFPAVKVTNLGRPVAVDRTEGTDRFAFAYRGEQVAELRPLPELAVGLVEWRLTFQDGHEAVLAAAPGLPPIGAALVFIDRALNREDFKPMV